MKSIDRRTFLKNSVLGAAAVSLPGQQSSAAQTAYLNASVVRPSRALGIIDTNVNLFNWPFLSLKYRDTKPLVANLRKHRVIASWAVRFEALLSEHMHG